VLDAVIMIQFFPILHVARSLGEDALKAGIRNGGLAGKLLDRQGAAIPLEFGKDSLSHGGDNIRVRIIKQEKSSWIIRAMVSPLSYKGFMKHMIRRINEEMKRKGMVQDKLAEMAGVSQSTVNRILNEETIPLMTNVIGIARALNVSVESLVCESDVKALLYLQIMDMSDQEIHDLLFQVRRDQYFRRHPEALQDESSHIYLSAPKLKT
jgi:transcriptional regulator with XRE-family HTH domain